MPGHKGMTCHDTLTRQTYVHYCTVTGLEQREFIRQYLCVHLCMYLWHGNEEVESEAENGSGQEHNEHSESSILKVSQLYLQEALEGDTDGVDWQEEGRKAYSLRGRWGGGVATTTTQFFSSLPLPRMKGMPPLSCCMIRIHTIDASKLWASQGTVEGNLRWYTMWRVVEPGPTVAYNVQPNIGPP